MPPVELESGRLQLTDDEIALYTPAAALVAKARHEHISLREPITLEQFVMLYLAHGIVTDDEEFMEEVMAVIESEMAKRKRSH